MAGRLRVSIELSKHTLRDIILAEIIQIKEQEPNLPEIDAWWKLVEKLENTNCFQNFQDILNAWRFAFKSEPHNLFPKLHGLQLIDLKRRAGLVD